MRFSIPVISLLLLLVGGTAASTAELPWWRYSYDVPGLGLVISPAYTSEETCKQDLNWTSQQGYVIKSNCKATDR